MLDYDSRWEEVNHIPEPTDPKFFSWAAEVLRPTLAEMEGEIVSEDDACPGCSERRVDYLAWLDDERVKCESCGEVYRP